MSIIKQSLGNSFNKLHPMLQKRYDISEEKPFQATGTMRKISGGPKWLYPFFYFGVHWKLLFPEHGENIPFTIKNTARHGKNGEEQIHWQRIFHFGEKRRYFNALMSLDKKRNIIEDYLGEPPLMYSDLKFSCIDGGLRIDSYKQRLVLGRIEIPLPKVLQGLATVTERYNEEKGVYEISVIVKNPIIGQVFGYEGEFTSDEIF
ncbi:DUF4166 domain-containing protein [Lottiidibacillus patelloidae]|nr:DUF4166 domain-containing protein [Lottiidibacillus patelloidae]